MGISARGKDSAKLRKAIVEAKRDGLGGDRVHFFENHSNRIDDEILLWDVRMGRQRVQDGDGFWQEHHATGPATEPEVARKWVGFEYLSDADNLLAIQFCFGSVPLKGCKGCLGDSCRVLAGITADAAQVSNIGVFQRKLTTAQERFISFGYRNDGKDAERCVQHQLRESVHSAADAVNLGVSIGPDDAVYSENFIKPYLRQSIASEKAGGTSVSFVSYLPPLAIRRWGDDGPQTSISQ
eukprot:2945275-Prymnesium_polylepis.1